MAKAKIDTMGQTRTLRQEHLQEAVAEYLDRRGLRVPESGEWNWNDSAEEDDGICLTVQVEPKPRKRRSEGA